MTQPPPHPHLPNTHPNRTTQQIQDLNSHLRAHNGTPHELLTLLAPVLDGIGLLPPVFRGYLPLRGGRGGGGEDGINLDADRDRNGDDAGEGAGGGGGIRRHIQPIQRVLLEEVVPTWGAELVRLGSGANTNTSTSTSTSNSNINSIGGGASRGGLALIDQFFCPDAFVNGSRAAGDVARAAYATLVSVSPAVLVPAPAPTATAMSSEKEDEDGHDVHVQAYALHILARLVVEYPLDRLYKAVFPTDGRASGSGSGRRDDTEVRRGVQWEDCVRDVCKVPVVVANAVAGAGASPERYRRVGVPVPEVLENAVYFDRMSVRFEELVAFLSSSSSSSSTSAALEPLTYLLTKLVHIGVFPAHPPVARSQPSFFLACLPTVRNRLALSSSSSSSSSTHYSAFWISLFQNLASSSSITLQSILASLFASLSVPLPLPSSSSSAHQKYPTLTQDRPTRGRIAREAALLRSLVGRADAERTPGLWQIAMGLVVGRDGWALGEVHARVFVAWVSGGAVSYSPSSCGSASASTAVDVKGTVVLDAFLGVVLDLWASPEHIKHSLLSRHRYTTALLLLTISYLTPPSTTSTSTTSPSAPVQNLVSSPTFISAIGTYIAHLDPAVRRCGMLAAEVVAHLCGRKLDFGGWDAVEDGEGLVWCREMRTLLRTRDVDVDVGVVLAGEEEDQEDQDVEMEDISTPAAAAAVAASATIPPPTRATFLPKPHDGYDSDDSLTGYASPPSSASSRSASPTPSELAEIEKDPTLSVGAKKVPRPVYLAQLGELLRAAAQGAGGARGPNDPHDADRVQMALDCAEGLIRRKMGYGTELEENAVNLVHAFLSLQDNFDLDGFSEKRQAAMNALVACAPTKATPTLIQEFFKNQYSTDQRFVALNALAMGARELADLPVPPTPSTANPTRTAFPSKLLPGPLHRKYLSASDVPGGTGSRLIADRADRELLPRMVEQLATDALDEHRSEAAKAAPPTIIRECRLRVQKPQLVSELPTPAASTPLNPFSRNEFPTASSAAPATFRRPKFIDIAAEHFILPLISAFWAFLRDSQALERRTAHLTGRARYHGAGTGLVLNPMVLAQLVRTLAVLVHAARNAREWMAVVAPDALEVGLTLGTRPVSSMEEDGGDDEAGGEADGPVGPSKEAALLTATLELALVVLDGALELDGGRVLGLEHTSLVLGLGEWAGKVFAGLERGLRVQGGGGAHEARLSRAAAGVVLKVDELTSKWSRSMIDL